MCGVNGTAGATPGMVNTATAGPAGTLNHGIAMNRYSLPSMGLHAPPSPAMAQRFRPAPAAPAPGPFPISTAAEAALAAPPQASGPVPIDVPIPQPAPANPMVEAGQAMRFRPMPTVQDQMAAAGQAQRFRPMAAPVQAGATGAPMVLPRPIDVPIPRPNPGPAALAYGQRVPLPNGGMGAYAAPGLAIADGDTMGRYVSVGPGALASIFGG